ncbi:hypothetical protein EPA93_01890 [Ktedonosporobacter rubrisoli]|uniref:Metal-sensing transcriptional repressor n=1 Tax=Ktedonosporobacter rubrisoli TaxID=2509675 RepID=A0A4P6JIS4_KTERU|nr:metal-sensing transcriptional repressor [Ktedonosporobacter rubrisoli]QBD74810.1 hypothetical protein EPA93_01890 [Ktedonosporobacter rubrisoli]
MDKQEKSERLKHIEELLSATRSMIERDEYCVDILSQTYQVRKEFEALEALMLKDHMHHCVPEGIKQDREQEVIDELLQLYTLVGNR